MCLCGQCVSITQLVQLHIVSTQVESAMKTGVKDYMRKVIKDEILAKFTEWRRRSCQFVPLAPHLAAPNAYMRHIDTACCLAEHTLPPQISRSIYFC